MLLLRIQALVISLGVALTDHAFENWMAGLKPDVTRRPIINLKIPGSHDAFSYSISSKKKVSPDAPTAARDLKRFPFAKRVIYNWSVTQGRNVTEQLKSGIRYFDVRTIYDVDANDFFVVHGLYGDRTMSVMKHIEDFLQSHSKEIVILDFNHFYRFSGHNHSQLAERLTRVFGNKLLPQPSQIDQVSLNNMWAAGYQVILIYHYPVEANFWQGYTISSPWPNTDTKATLWKDLNVYVQNNHTNRFFVLQALRTAEAWDIATHLFSSLRRDLSIPTTTACLTWMQSLNTFERANVNIIEADFTVDVEGFISSVIYLNQRH